MSSELPTGAAQDPSNSDVMSDSHSQLDKSASNMEIPLAYRAVSSGLWVSISSYWVTAFGFAANIFLTRLLTPEIYGQFALASFFAIMFQLRTKVALNQAFIQYRIINGRTVGTYWTLDILLAIGGVVLALLAIPFLIAFGYAPAVIWMMFVLVVLNALDSLLSGYGVVLEASLHYRPGSIITSVALPASYLPAIWFAMNGKGEYSLISQAATLAILSLFFGLVYVVARMQHIHRLHWRFNRPLAARFLSFGAVTGFGGFLSTLTTQVDNFILGSIAGTVALGFYDRAYRTAQWPSLLLSPLISRTVLATYGQLRDDPDKLIKTIKMVLWISANVALPTALVLFIAGPDLVLLLYGEKWLPAVPLMRILLLASVLRPVWENVGALYVALGIPHRFLFVLTIQLVLLASVGTVLAYYFGAIGIACAVVITMLTAVAMGYQMIVKHFPIRSLSILVVPLTVAVLTVLVYGLLDYMFDLESLRLGFRLLLKILYSVLAFWLFSFLFRPNATIRQTSYVIKLIRSSRSFRLDVPTR